MFITKNMKKDRSFEIVYVFVLLCTVLRVVDGRKAIEPIADVEDILKQDGLAGADTDAILADRNASPCTLDIQSDLPKPDQPQPLYIRPQSVEYWLPNANGQLEVPRGAAIELYCTSSFANATVDVGAAAPQGIPRRTFTLKPVCLQDKTFLLNGAKYEFRHFVCAQAARYSVERLACRCADNTAQLYRVGYNVSGDRFLDVLQVCHDEDAVQTYYVYYQLLPANLQFQRFVRRLNFSKAGHFGQLNMNYLYTQKNQRRQLALLLGDPNVLQYFDFEETFFLARGHLAAKSDMIYATQQRATFTYFNAAPQWQSFNGGQWAKLEDEVRRFVAKAQLAVDCYTGTWGVLQLYLSDGVRRPFYLEYDANNNGLLPVPQLYYRVLIDSAQPWRGIALVGVNDPYATMPQILEEYVICEDVREQVPWLRWMRNNEQNLKKGYVYACRVEEFAQVVWQLPRHLLQVNELLLGA